MSSSPSESRPSSPFINGLFRVVSLVWWLVLVILILLALYVGLGRQLTKNIDQYRTSLEQQLTDELGQQVTISGLSAHWQWLDPVISADSLALYAKNELGETAGNSHSQPKVRLRHLRLRLDSLASLLRFRIVFQEFEADGLDLTITRTEAGEISVEGLGQLAAIGTQTTETEGFAGGAQVWIDRLGAWLSNPFIRITRINLGINVPGEDIRYLDIPQLDLVYEQGLFHASGRAMRSGTNMQVARFNLSGHHFFRGGFDGQLYLDVNSGRLFDGLIQGFGWKHLTVLGFDVVGQSWINFEAGKLVGVQGEVNVSYLLLEAERETLAPIEDIRAQFGWRPARLNQNDDGENTTFGVLHLRNLAWKWTTTTAPPFDARFSLIDGRLEIVGRDIPVGPLQRLSSGLQLLPGVASRALTDYQPNGTMRNMTLTVPSYSENTFDLQAALSQVSVAAHDGAPGASGISGHLHMNESGGWVDVDSKAATLSFPELFRAPWQFNALTARVAWLLEGEVTRVFSDDIRMDYQEATVFTGGFDLRLDRGGEDSLGLQVAIRQGDAGMLADFVPSKVVSEELYSWLTESIVAATITEGKFYGHGLIGNNAPDGSFTTSMNYRFTDATVTYDQNWPEVTNAGGEVVVHNGRADIRLDQGETGGLTLAPSNVVVAEQEDDSGILVFINTAARVPGDAVDHWLEATPVGNMAGPSGRSLRFGGIYNLELALELPIGSEQPITVDASVTTDNGEIRYPDADLLWTGIDGRLKYGSASGFSSDAFKANFLEGAVEVRLSETEGGLEIVQTGSIQSAMLLREAGVESIENTGISGATDYSAVLKVSDDTAATLKVNASLKNITIDWPTPLAKPAGAEVPLTVVVDWRQDGGIELAGDWHERLAYRLTWRDGAFDRGRVALAARSTQLPDHSGLNIAGPINELDTERWQEALDRLVDGDSESNAGPAASGDTYTWLDSIDLTIGNFILAGNSFPLVTLRARPEPYGWVFDTVSERLSGRVMVPFDAASDAQVGMEKLLLTSHSASQSATQSTSEPPLVLSQVEAFRAMGLENWPDVDVRIDSFGVGNSDYGAWLFRLEPEQDSLEVLNLEGRLNSLFFKGGMSWGLQGDKEITRLNGEMKGGSLEDLSALVEGDVPFRNQQSQMLLDIAWAGRPDDYALKALEGTISMRFDDGVILERSDTAQLFRIFNLLNSDTLLRRLKLDFSDLYEAGVAFDAISGKAELGNGTLTWDPELQIVGPSGAFKLSGTSDLTDETLDMRLVVVLPLTQNLPLAALLLGASAPIGGALFVLDKVLGDPLSKLTSATYSVGGSWDEPDVRLRSVFDTGQ
ncbi:MAG: YhdP family protein [Marinobacter sp.]|uniref:YhdP family protein n=1 Tax=Marinobacter sp. TaxID=50741 RepID=UPI0034A02A4D